METLTGVEEKNFHLDRKCPTASLGFDQKERQSMTNQKQQMELGFDKARVCPSVRRRQSKSTRAKWWFDRMRDAVDRAIDWQPAPAARPEQIWFPE
jgi:hypothetical protein